MRTLSIQVSGDARNVLPFYTNIYICSSSLLYTNLLHPIIDTGGIDTGK